ncbi:MAG: hypothetical protein WC402_03145 [Candidatus Pacearchaeota archaeon]|jgi:DNA-binding MarR family transcriptional regulator
MVKIKLPPLENENYTKILVEIGGESPSIQELADRVKKEISTVSENLNELEQIGCIRRTKNKKLFRNRKEVSINWLGLNKQYLIYLIKEQKIEFSKREIEDYTENKYLQKLIRLYLTDHQKSIHNFRKIGTIYQLFDQITIQMIYGDETFSDPQLKRLKKIKYSFMEFRNFIKKIKYRKTANQRKTFRKYLKLIIKELEKERISKKNN